MEAKARELLSQLKTGMETKLGTVDELKATIDALTKRVEGYETAMSRPNTHGQDPQDISEEKAAFYSWMRKGDKKISSEEKAMLISDDTTGGVLAPDDYQKEILKSIVLQSPFRQYARVMNTSARAINVPKRTGMFSAVWIGEADTRSETTGLTYGMEEIPVHEVYALVDISLVNLEDSAFNLEQELSMEFSEQFAVAEGIGFLTGSGIAKPEGVLTNADIAHVASGAATSISSADCLVEMFYDLKEPYARNAVWMMNRATVGKISKLKTAEGDYLWQPGLSQGAPDLLLGRPIVAMPDMPDVGAGKDAIIFGDFTKGYIVADRVGLSVQRDPYTQSASGLVRFLARRRVGGQVVMPEAMKKLRIESS